MHHEAARILLAIALTLSVCGCGERALAFGNGPTSGNFDLSGPRPLRDELDLLLVIDDSKGMTEAQRLLIARLPDLISQLDNANRNIGYHIGVVTTDLGAPGISCGANRGGRLQSTGAAATDCTGPVGKPYIERRADTGEVNLPDGQSLSDTLRCMAAVGAGGCQFTMPLEAAYRALLDPQQNQSFLRDNASLAILFFTDWDDCSVDPDSALFGADPALGAMSPFRCTRFGIRCDGQFPLPDGDLFPVACQPASVAQGSKLTDIEKYIRYFSSPASEGGVKIDPRDVLLAVIAGPSMYFSVSMKSVDNCQKSAAYPACSLLVPSCTTADPITARPAVRLQAVAQKASNNAFTSMCDPDYETTLSKIAALIGVL
jgi:hypothetical protein